MCLYMSFERVEIPHPCCEYLYPFGNYQSEYYDSFSIFVHSPSQSYYNEIFGSFLLTPDEAWQLYHSLLDTQQVGSAFKDAAAILDPIPDHLSNLEMQFRLYYETAYYNILTKYNKLL